MEAALAAIQSTNTIGPTAPTGVGRRAKCPSASLRLENGWKEAKSTFIHEQLVVKQQLLSL